MSGGNKPPPAPNPAMIAAQTSQANKDTAIANARLSAVNQRGPYGNLTYSENGTNPDGTPRFSADYALDPRLQGLYESATRNLQSTLSTPFDLNGNAGVEARLMELGRARLDPIFQQRQGSLESQLLNSGYQRGSDAWNRQMDQFSRGQNDAYNQLLLTGRGQAVNELMAQRQMPMQEFASLTSSRPFGFNGLPTPQGQIANTDTAGIYNNAYQNQLAQYGLQNQQSNALMGGLFGLGGTVLGGLAGGPLGGKLLGPLAGNMGNSLSTMFYGK
jgi:hypothetical protein